MSGVATAPTLTANSQIGSYTVMASVSGLATPATFNLTNTSGGTGLGSLAGSVATSPSPVNLTAAGTSDWIHWGDTYGSPAAFNHKASGGSQISNYTVVGSTRIYTYNFDPRPVSWTDGSPAASANSNTNGILNGYSAAGQGFSFTAPAGTATRTLVVYCGGQFDGGMLTASLSDGSAPNFTYTASRSYNYDLTITLTYNASSNGQTLTVQWVDANLGGGTIWLVGAALQ
jgi:hypothetical protein